MLAVATYAAAVAHAGGCELLQRRGGRRDAGQAGVDGLTKRAERFGARVELVGEGEFRFGFEG